jgi:arylsulfatase A-like enzyme
VIGIASWCGLVAGLLEVAIFCARKVGIDANPLYGVSRQFVWHIPLTYTVIYVSIGVCGWILSRFWPRSLSRYGITAFCALTLLPALFVAVPRIYGPAWLALALGIAWQVAPSLERNWSGMRKLVVWTWPPLLVFLGLLALVPWLESRNKQARATAMPAPRSAAPNILLVVLDTVGARHLGLYGYSRPTSPTLEQLAARGIRFDRARSGSSWTLPSHAVMFTGKWAHELKADWLTPLDDTYPTVAEYLTDRGYATAGFVANYPYCAWDSGLARGFAHYEDFWYPALTWFKGASLVARTLEGLERVNGFLESELEISYFEAGLAYLHWLFDSNRKTAGEVNRELLTWLSQREQTERPFFAFLNYYDAHTPYRVPPGRPYRFWAVPEDAGKRELIENWGKSEMQRVTREDIEFAIASYDECVADLDEQLGILWDELERSGTLAKTWVFVVADHGESFGEHPGVISHGSSLYQSEVHVPLVVVPPGGTSKQTVADAVSLRDIAATIVDVSGLANGSPFPGSSLVSMWTPKAPATDKSPRVASDPLTGVDPLDTNAHDVYGLPRTTWPLKGLADSDWSYIRRDHDRHEELFDLRADPAEQRNRAADPQARTTLERMRSRVKALTAHPAP